MASSHSKKRKPKGRIGSSAQKTKPLAKGDLVWVHLPDDLNARPISFTVFAGIVAEDTRSSDCYVKVLYDNNNYYVHVGHLERVFNEEV